MTVKIGRLEQNFFKTPYVISEESDIYSLLGEPSDPESAWSELKVAHYAGENYIFISRNLNKKLARKTTLTEFMQDIYQLLESAAEQARLIIYMRNAYGQYEFCSFDLVWQQSIVVDFTIDVVKDLEKKSTLRNIFSESRLFFGSL